MLNTSQFIEQCKVIHDNFYSYDKTVYTKANQKIVITCPLHGDFEQVASNHKNMKQGCPSCNGKFKYTQTEFIEKCSIIHNGKYDYSKVTYNTNKSNVIITCPFHGDFKQKACHHLSGKECIKCAAKKRAKPRTYTNDDYIELCLKKHNNLYSYEKTNYTKSTKKIIITCPIHGDFKQNAAMHLSGQGCPLCVKSSNSKNVILISSYLLESHIEFIREFRFKDCKNKKPLPFDFYIPQLNLCIEYDGIQHFKSISKWGGDEGLLYRQKNDEIKNQYCKDNNINLLRIRYDDDIESVLNHYFK